GVGLGNKTFGAACVSFSFCETQGTINATERCTCSGSAIQCDTKSDGCYFGTSGPPFPFGCGCGAYNALCGSDSFCQHCKSGSSCVAGCALLDGGTPCAPCNP